MRILQYLIPLLIIVQGVSGIWFHRMSIKGAPVENHAAIYYGTGFILWGIALLGMPSVEHLKENGFNGLLKIRLTLLLLGTGCMLAGLFSLF